MTIKVLLYFHFQFHSTSESNMLPLYDLSGKKKVTLLSFQDMDFFIIIVVGGTQIVNIIMWLRYLCNLMIQKSWKITNNMLGYLNIYFSAVPQHNKAFILG